MRKAKLTSVSAFLLAIVMVVSILPPVVFADDTAAESEVASGRRSMQEWNEILNTVDYATYLEKHASAAEVTDVVTIDGTRFDADGTSAAEVEVMHNVHADGRDSLYTSDSSRVTWKVTVPKAGLYTIGVDCFTGDAKHGAEAGEAEKSTDVERIVYINGKVPFSEARSIVFRKSWAPIYQSVSEDGESVQSFRRDLAGNDLRPDNAPANEWRTVLLRDSTGYYTAPLLFYFEAGENTISFEATRSAMSVREITLAPAAESKVLPYEEYRAACVKLNGEKTGTDETIKIEAEFPTIQSDESIYPLTDRTSAITSPQDPKIQRLNFMGGNENFKTVGQWTEYTFDIKDSGFYTIALRYKQNDLSGMFASRRILIDGELPFEECNALRFNYSSDWQVKTLGDGETEYEFYLLPGKHTLRIEVSLGDFADIIRRVKSTLENINNCYLEIIKLTGADPDEYRDYGFSRLMPNTIKTMLIESRNLYAVSEEITELTGEKGSQTATLDKVAFLLNRMGSDEDEIASNLSNLKTYIGTLGTWLNGVRTQPLRIDYLMVQPKGTPLPKANANFFEAIGFELKSFISSFTTDYSTMGAVSHTTDENTSIDVWLTLGRDQAKILKNLVSSDFTPDTGTGVNVKLVAAGTLLPSVLSGQGPDVFHAALGVDVINYAIRSAVLPLNKYDGFEDIISEFNTATTVPVTLYGTTYGLPEHASFYMMFVRVDILSSLGLEVPKTWDDVLAMLPVLQANNMSVGLNREYDLFLYQMGGDRFADDGLRCGLDSNIALDAFEKYTRFYTDYSFPVKFDGPNRFRTGEMPILIAEYVTTYNTLTVFATEINGLWEMVPLPGSVREDGSINHNAVNTVSASIMLHGTEDENSAWQYMKWYCGHDAQAAYGSDLVTTIGQAAKYNTANKEALEEMPWTTSEKTALMDQFNHLSAVTNYPGAYIFTRYLNFAYLAVVNSGADPVTELQSYVNTINKEITRKRSEFDLPVLDPGKTYETAPQVKAEMTAWIEQHMAEQNAEIAAWRSGTAN